MALQNSTPSNASLWEKRKEKSTPRSPRSGRNAQSCHSRAQMLEFALSMVKSTALVDGTDRLASSSVMFIVQRPIRGHQLRHSTQAAVKPVSLRSITRFGSSAVLTLGIALERANRMTRRPTSGPSPLRYSQLVAVAVSLNSTDACTALVAQMEINR
jgi:hypothetical protein